MSPRTVLPTFSPGLTEGDVRRFSGDATFSRADAWQRAGQVYNPTFRDQGLSAEILGTWRRVDTVQATVTGGRIRTQCTCEGGEWCRHAAALLLQWLRDPASFALEERRVEPDLEEVEPINGRESAHDEFARLLQERTMAQLREAARRRGERVTAQYKDDLVERLASILGAAESVDAALSGLDDDARIALVATDLVGAGSKASRQAIGMAYRAFGGQGQMDQDAPVAMDTLVELALVFPQDRWTQPPNSYLVPRVVAQRIPVSGHAGEQLGRLLRVVDPSSIKERTGNAAPESGPSAQTERSLGLIEVFQVIAHEMGRGAIGANTPTVQREEIAHIPRGWRIDPSHGSGDQSSTGRRPQYIQSVVHRLVPLPTPLTRADRQRLVDLTGQSEGMIDFALLLMLAMGLVEIGSQQGQYHLIAQADLLQTFLALPPTGRSTVLLETYLAAGQSSDLRMVVGPNRALQLYCKGMYYENWEQAQPNDSAVRRLLARILSRLSQSESQRDTWFDFTSLLDLLWNLAPSLLGQSAPQYWEWWFTEGKPSSGASSGRRLNLEARADWRRVWSPLVAAMLAGPLNWLGLVQTVTDEKGVLAFRVLPAAAILLGDGQESALDLPSSQVPPLSIEMHPADGVPVVLVPAGTPDTSVYTLLAHIGELMDAAPRGLRFRITPDRLQRVFDEGIAGADVIRFLSDRARGTLPPDVYEALERWGNSYGAIRLYDDVTLIELGDDVLLHELRASSSLDGALVHVFSPRLIAVDTARTEELVTELTRLGHTPRLVEEG